jgi:Spy/CpxP family protein refolding chaperone
MKIIHALTGAALLAVAAAGSLPAQDAPPPPEQRPRQLRLHAPGTGLEDGPAMRQRMREGRSQMVTAGMYTPHWLIARKDMLDLTEEQLSQLEQLDAEAAAVREQAGEALKQSQEQLQEAWKAAQPDAEAIRRYAQAGMEARQEVQLATLEGAARAKALLTPEQQGKLAGFVEGRRMGMRQRGMRGQSRQMRGTRDAARMRQRCPGC